MKKTILVVALLLILGLVNFSQTSYAARERDIPIIFGQDIAPTELMQPVNVWFD